MREQMLNAEVGDDVYGEDPTVRRLEERTAEIVGKEAALFVPSGTMSNQIALLCHTRPGDEVIVSDGAHCAFYESGAAPAWSGVQFAYAGRDGLFSAEDAASAIRADEYYLPRTSLIVIENTHNRAGGKIFPQKDVLAIAELARSRKLGLHLDGARIWNASAELRTDPATLAAPFDTVSVCFSKGLGAAAGSALCGSADRIRAARRFRKMLGGGMRQAGILAAGALYALEHHRERLRLDHEHARAIAKELQAIEGAFVPWPETNIVVIDTPSVESAKIVAAAKERGVLIGSMGRFRTRAVTHLDVGPEQIAFAARVLADAVSSALASSPVHQSAHA